MCDRIALCLTSHAPSHPPSTATHPSRSSARMLSFCRINCAFWFRPDQKRSGCTPPPPSLQRCSALRISPTLSGRRTLTSFFSARSASSSVLTTKSSFAAPHRRLHRASVAIDSQRSSSRNAHSGRHSACRASLAAAQHQSPAPIFTHLDQLSIQAQSLQLVIAGVRSQHATLSYKEEAPQRFGCRASSPV